MIPMSFDYVRADSLDDALSALAADPDTQVLAGGQTLLPLMRFRLAAPGRLLDIGRLDELRGIRHGDDGARIGGGTRYRDLLESESLAASHPIVAEATRGIGDLQVRNVGTIGGALAHADPASDMPAVMMALDAGFTLRSQTGERTVAAREFFEGPFMTALEPNELLTEIHLPALPDGTGTAYFTFEQKASGYPLAGAAAVVTMAGGAVSGASLAFAGVSDAPFVADSGALVGGAGDADAVMAAAAAAVEGVRASADIHASADYRLHLARVAAGRALAAAISRAA